MDVSYHSTRKRERKRKRKLHTHIHKKYGENTHVPYPISNTRIHITHETLCSI